VASRGGRLQSTPVRPALRGSEESRRPMLLGNPCPQVFSEGGRGWWNHPETGGVLGICGGASCSDSSLLGAGGSTLRSAPMQ
jgi:hypothetical protein